MKCLYHANCSDGLAAAAAVYLAAPDHGASEDLADYIPVQHGSPPPWDEIDGQDVVIVDFSYKRDVMLEMSERCNTVLVLDHHASAERDLVDLADNTYAHFDMERSGAVMAWDFFHNYGAGRTHQAPLLYEYIQDRDLWTKHLPGCDDVAMAIRSYPPTIPEFLKLLEVSIPALRAEGRGIRRWLDLQVEAYVKAWRKAPLLANIGGHHVPLINAPGFMASELAGELAELYPFAAVFFHVHEPADDVGKWVFSLRRRDGDVDLSTIAAQAGGGGHPAAAGFSVPGILVETVRIEDPNDSKTRVDVRWSGDLLALVGANEDLTMWGHQ
ncbi:MAG: DHHA1 domain-containing protein [Arhodomonas sp.]|nr:DHHA1 domain-containing protein [Arhodomonas sp.]